MKIFATALTLISVLGITTSTFAVEELDFPAGRTTAVYTGAGSDPNGNDVVNGESSQAGVTLVGASSANSQVPFCDKCEQSPVRLNQAKRIARPGVKQPSQIESGGVGSNGTGISGGSNTEN